MPFLAGDWGTSRLRCWLVEDDGRAGPRRDFAFGAAALAPGAAPERLAEARAAMGAERLPAVLCGMIGSDLGWMEAPYLACPADLADLAGALARPAADVAIAPGLACAGLLGPDVMRGEETQIAGWLAADPARRRGRFRLVLPGTHCKWVEVAHGRVERFVTAMTGELFALLLRLAVIGRGAKSEAPFDAAAFDAGAAAAGDGGALAARLFALRGKRLSGELSDSAAPSWLSGLLIGAEIAALAPLAEPGHDGLVHLIGEPALSARYARACAARSLRAASCDGEAAVLAGLTAIRRAC